VSVRSHVIGGRDEQGTLRVGRGLTSAEPVVVQPWVISSAISKTLTLASLRSFFTDSVLFGSLGRQELILTGLLQAFLIEPRKQLVEETEETLEEAQGGPKVAHCLALGVMMPATHSTTR